jgi:hypothetical protein
MQDCVIGALAKKTVILVTHQVEFLAAVEIILVSGYVFINYGFIWKKKPLFL